MRQIVETLFRVSLNAERWSNELARFHESRADRGHRNVIRHEVWCAQVGVADDSVLAPGFSRVETIERQYEFWMFSVDVARE